MISDQSARVFPGRPGSRGTRPWPARGSNAGGGGQRPSVYANAYRADRFVNMTFKGGAIRPVTGGRERRTADEAWPHPPLRCSDSRDRDHRTGITELVGSPPVRRRPLAQRTGPGWRAGEINSDLGSRRLSRFRCRHRLRASRTRALAPWTARPVRRRRTLRRYPGRNRRTGSPLVRRRR